MFVERFERDGCLVIDRLFDPALIDRVRAEYDRQYGAIDPDAPPPHLKVGTARMHLPVSLTGALLDPELYANPLLLEALLKPLLGSAFVIDNVNVVTAFPGAGKQRSHRDHPGLFALGTEFGASLPCYALTLAIPLIDLAADCGTTELFPGSMARDSEEDGGVPDLGPGVLPFVSRGGCFLMDYRLWHRGLANRSDRPRPILYIVYARDWFTDVVNFTEHARLVVDPDNFERIPLEHRALFQRAAGKGLLDATIRDLKAVRPKPASAPSAAKS